MKKTSYLGKVLRNVDYIMNILRADYFEVMLDTAEFTVHPYRICYLKMKELKYKNMFVYPLF
jgi:hypothetical protein